MRAMVDSHLPVDVTRSYQQLGNSNLDRRDSRRESAKSLQSDKQVE